MAGRGGGRWEVGGLVPVGREGWDERGCKYATYTREALFCCFSFIVGGERAGQIDRRGEEGL